MANINTKRKRKAGVAGYGVKRKHALDTTRVNKTPWLIKQALKNKQVAPITQQ